MFVEAHHCHHSLGLVKRFLMVVRTFDMPFPSLIHLTNFPQRSYRATTNEGCPLHRSRDKKTILGDRQKLPRPRWETCRLRQVTICFQMCLVQVASKLVWFLAQACWCDFPSLVL